MLYPQDVVFVNAARCHLNRHDEVQYLKSTIALVSFSRHLIAGVNVEILFACNFDIFPQALLTHGRRRRMVCPINGKNPLWRPSNLLFQTVSRHVSCGYFCARIPGASSRLGREGGEYNTLRGNKPACLWTGLKPPATSAVLQSLIGGVVKRRPEGFDMTDDIDGQNPSEFPRIYAEQGVDPAIERRAQAVAAMLVPYIRDYMMRDSSRSFPPDIGLMIARYQTFGLDCFGPDDPAFQRRACSISAACTLVDAASKLRAVADELNPDVMLTEEGNDWAREQVVAALTGILSIEIDAGLL
tara:strand:+ start:14225 stop:15121 length:897 start_codon:yes stop_codon:yes gene_type:complete